MAVTKALTPRSMINALDRSMARIEFAPDGTILDANQNFLDVMGYTLDEIRGRHHSIFLRRRSHPLERRLQRFLGSSADRDV